MLTEKEQQKLELKTVREKKIIVNLSEADCDRLYNLCGEHGLTVSGLLECFIGNLVRGTKSCDSAAEDVAGLWMERCRVAMRSEKNGRTFLQHLLEGAEAERFCQVLEFIEDTETDLAKYEKSPELFKNHAVEQLKEMYAYWKKEYRQYVNEYMKMYPKADIETEIAVVKTWYADKEAFRKS
ncbi:MAG: hypothetical protein J6J42_04100 [Lachnospiraceae bacterium]|nr:hypothetical protein [Lachnospiraceae bacterium]